MLSPRDALASACLGCELLAIGGHDGSNYIASCEVYSASTPGHGRFPRWTWIPSLSASRAFHAATTARGRVLVFGGQGSRTGKPGGYGDAPVREAMVLSSCEVMDEQLQGWSSAPELPSPRTMMAGASTIDRHFCIGGRTGKFDQSPALDSVLALDLRMKSWMQLPSLREKKYGAAAASWNGRVYVFGGHDLAKPLSTVEVVFDERRNAWSECEPMKHERVFSQVRARVDDSRLTGAGCAHGRLRLRHLRLRQGGGGSPGEDKPSVVIT
ncbi:hypothetical protein GUITHDRAFT_67622 [Guillardia theta CCMP2712]|uniref:Uncharacterized protein n=1 Tax=Guillardia theta (strain CCMP2712) TaxID=905079 RepID=L1JNC6_GUITC|nr:hypothetical protein GUITHDRAFT_67622 [Guillardia theta CCMP2712]EKX49695.1 hypothetical protein GUITHDRAFT_67622 [Guillardia theta CCMP2712]|eukprot:XP_005836675.1 hypothetical protein GUITHDRAFT_67622 [Guillardia theta CCMP2712]